MTLSKLAAILAGVFIITFGLCTITVIGSPQPGSDIFGISVVIEAVCAVGLLVIGVIAIVRSATGKEG